MSACSHSAPAACARCHPPCRSDGDSITQLIKRNGVFPSFFNNNSAALGVSGNDIEDLAWRLMTAHGAENPAIPPKVVAILIGAPWRGVSPCACIRRARRARCACATAATANALPRPHARTHAGLNNMQAGQKVVEILRKLDYLLAWAQAAWPHTKIMLVSLLPNAKYNTGALNKQYVALAAKRRLAWALCGQDINARDKAQLYDGTHPTVAAQRKLLSCLAQHVAALAAEKAGR